MPRIPLSRSAKHAAGALSRDFAANPSSAASPLPDAKRGVEVGVGGTGGWEGGRVWSSDIPCSSTCPPSCWELCEICGGMSAMGTVTNKSSLASHMVLSCCDAGLGNHFLIYPPQPPTSLPNPHPTHTHPTPDTPTTQEIYICQALPAGNRSCNLLLHIWIAGQENTADV